MSTKPEEVQIELFIDFDGTVTETGGESTISNKHYKNLKANGQENDSHHYAKFKPIDEIKKLIEGKELFEGKEFPENLKMKKEAVELIKKGLNAKPRYKITFISNNRSEVIKAHLMANGIAEENIGIVKSKEDMKKESVRPIRIVGTQEMTSIYQENPYLFTSRNNKNAVVKFFLKFEPHEANVEVTKISGTWDDNFGDHNGMRTALIESKNFTEVVGQYAAEGKYDFAKEQEVLAKALQSAKEKIGATKDVSSKADRKETKQEKPSKQDTAAQKTPSEDYSRHYVMRNVAGNKPPVDISSKADTKEPHKESQKDTSSKPVSGKETSNAGPFSGSGKFVMRNVGGNKPSVDLSSKADTKESQKEPQKETQKDTTSKPVSGHEKDLTKSGPAKSGPAKQPAGKKAEPISFKSPKTSAVQKVTASSLVKGFISDLKGKDNKEVSALIENVKKNAASNNIAMPILRQSVNAEIQILERDDKGKQSVLVAHLKTLSKSLEFRAAKP